MHGTVAHADRAFDIRDVERFRAVRLEGLRSDPAGFRFSEAEDDVIGTSARGTGAADAIMRALIAHAREHVRQLQLAVLADNARAPAFYERHGFVHYATEPQAVKEGNEYCDEAAMWLSFAAG